MCRNPDVYAIPGASSIIDEVNPETGLTRVYGHTEAEVLEREPGAVRLPWDAWRAQQVTRQQTPIRWVRTTQQKYDEMLGVLPPIEWRGGAFLVGEPYDHCWETGRPRYTAFWHRGGYHLVASRPLTVAELRAELAIVR